MAITGNKGEWSEIYALFKLLGEGRVYAGDAFMHRTNVFYPILDIIRTEEKRYEYRPWSCSDGDPSSWKKTGPKSCESRWADFSNNRAFC